MRNDLLKEKALEDVDNEVAIRPESMNEFIGQKNVMDNLAVFLSAAKKRCQSLDHAIIYGPPGLGKTTLAKIIAKELMVNFCSTSGPIISKTGDLAAILTNLSENDVLFIDEIHRLNVNVEEILYSAMEDFKLDILIGEGPAARTVKIDLPRFTLVGATTRIGLLSNPLRDRFGIQLRLEFYNDEDLLKVLKRASGVHGVNYKEAGLIEIAKRSRGTPRIALRLLRRVKDFVDVSEDKIINCDLANFALNKLGIDEFGLDSIDHKYLRFIIDMYNGGPVGIDTICSGLSEQKDNIEETVEPFLIKQGFINRTPRGRVVNKICIDHIVKKYKL